MSVAKKDEDIVEKKPKLEKEKKVKKKSGAGKFFLGWFLGTIINIVVLVGAGFWAYKNVTLSGLEKTFGFKVEALSEDAKHLTLENMVGEVVNIASNFDSMTIIEITDGLGLNLDDVMRVEGTGEDKVYKFKGIDITAIVTGKISEASSNAQEVIDGLSLGGIEEAFEITLPDYEFLNALKDTPLKDLGTETDGIFDSYTLNKLSSEFGVNFTDVDMLSGLLDTPFSELPEEINNLYVRDVIDTTGATGVLKAIEDIKISELGTEIETLAIEDIFDEATINNNSVLKALKTAKINNLSSAIDNLKVNDLYPSSSNKIIQAIGSYSVTNLTVAFDSIKINEVIDMAPVANPSYVAGTSPVYEQYKPRGVWAFVDGNTLLKDMDDLDLSFDGITLAQLKYEGILGSGIDMTKDFNGSPLGSYTIQGLLQELTD